MRRRGGKLSEDDREIWSKVAKTTAPLRTPCEFIIDEPEPKPIKPNRPVKPLRQIGGLKSEPKITVHPYKETSSAPQMDRKNFDRLKRGKMRPDARIDLHGMTAAEAQVELHHFIQHCHGAGKRLALVITGKGKAVNNPDSIMPERTGILKQSLPTWLKHPALRPLILEVVTAHTKHGGGGAFYVYLRRKR